MNFVCTRCGRKEAVTTRAAHCTCGGLWKLEADLPAFDLSGVDTHEWSLFRYRKFMALEDKILEARAALARKGVYCEHTTAANYAAYLEYRRLNGPTPDTLLTMCGAGLKSDH